MIKRLLFRLAKSPGMGSMVGWAFRWCWWAIPVRRVFRSRRVLAFEHPRPAYADHIILSPRALVGDLFQMGETKYMDCLPAIWQAVRMLAANKPEYRHGFTLVANGGRRQEVGQVHFHLFTGHSPVGGAFDPQQAGEPLFCNDAICIHRHPAPEWELHFVLYPAAEPEAAERSGITADTAPAAAAYLRAVSGALAVLQSRYSITEKGFSLAYQQTGAPAAQPVFQLIAGRKTSSSTK